MGLDFFQTGDVPQLHNLLVSVAHVFDEEKSAKITPGMAGIGYMLESLPFFLIC